MNASQPEANTEYSTGARGSSRAAGRGGRRPRRPRRVPGSAEAADSRALRGLAAAGALLLVAAEFCALLQVRTVAAHPRLVRSVQGGPHHDWALLVIAVLAGLLGALTRRVVARPAAAATALLGAGALAVVLGVDLPDAHAAGIVTVVGAPVEAEAHAGLGLYLESLGGVALLIAGATMALVRRGGWRS